MESNAVPIDRLMPAIRARVRIDGETRVGGFRLVEYSYLSQVSVSNHYHDWASVHLVRTGEVHETYVGRQRHARPGDALYYAAGAAHKTSLPAGSRVFHVAFSPRMGFGFTSEFAEREPQGIHASVSAIAVRLLAEHQRGASGSQLILESTLVELMSVLYARPEKPDLEPAWLPRVLDLIHASPARPVSIAVLAQQAGVHPCHLVRSFRLRLGCTPGHYLRAIRLQEAVRRISGSHDCISAIAHQLGYADQSHLCRDMTRYFRLPPARLRKAMIAEAMS